MLTHKFAALYREDTLRHIEVLDKVLGYVGPGHRLFIADVNKLWQQTYTAATATDLPNVQAYRTGIPTTFSFRFEWTLLQAVFASKSTLRWAHDAGLSIVSDSNDSWQQQVKVYSVGLYADQDTLT
jgi:hypothetical protein